SDYKLWKATSFEKPGNKKAMCEYMNRSQIARRSQAEARYFDKFCSYFWKRPEDPFDRNCNMNISNHRHSRRGSSPAPSIEEVERELSQRLSS
ncbi:8094_t:CDS:2, partial [Funneliformis mosseae]